MKGILLLILIVPLLGLLALGSALKANPPQLPQPTRGQSDGALCFGSVVFLGMVGVVLFPSLWNDTRGTFSGWQTPMAIQHVPHFWDRHKQVEWDCTDPEGTVIGYRYLNVIQNGMNGNHVELSSGPHFAHRRNKVLNRPSGSWGGAMNISDRVPTMRNTSGIYAAKTPDSPILDSYRIGGSVLVKMRLGGARVIEAEYGYRAHKAELLECLEYIPFDWE